MQSHMRGRPEDKLQDLGFGTIHISESGVPNLVYKFKGQTYSVCYFTSTNSYRVFWPYPSAREKQRHASLETPDEVRSFFQIGKNSIPELSEAAKVVSERDDLAALTRKLTEEIQNLKSQLASAREAQPKAPAPPALSRREEVFVRAWTSTARANNCISSQTATNYAKECLHQFDLMFGKGDK